MGLEKPAMFLIRMLQIRVGAERQIVETLAKRNKKALYFKILGRHDILELSRPRSLHDSRVAYTEPAILATTTFPCFSWSKNTGDCWTALSESISPCLTFLKLHEVILDDIGIEGLVKVLTYLDGLRASDHPGPIFPQTSLGHYDIAMWYPSDDLEAIFKLMRKLRNLTIKEVFAGFDKRYNKNGVFLDTMTLPLISYRQVIKEKKWSLLKGKVKPVIRLKCIPAKELEVALSLGAKVHDILGEEDLFVLWKNPIPLAELIPKVLDFRGGWTDNLGLIRTTTNLLSITPVSARGQLTHAATMPSVKHIMETLRSLSSVKNINEHLINELISIVSVINSAISRHLSSSSVEDIIDSMLSYLNELLTDYIKCLREETLQDKAQDEIRLLLYAYSVRLALSQRLPGPDISELEFLVTNTVGRVIRATSVVVGCLLGTFTESPLPATFEACVSEDIEKSAHAKWAGFTFFDLIEGYRVSHGELFSIPASDLFVPLDWTTLSHEIAHAIYIRLRFPTIEREFLENLSKNIKKAKPEKLETYERELGRFCSELFAHWFDYRHFFAGEADFYLWNIWRTWLQVPRVFSFKTDYWLRSVFIKLCDSWTSLSSKFECIDNEFAEDQDSKNRAIMKIIDEQFEWVKNFLQANFKDEYTTFSLDQKQEDRVKKGLFYYYHFTPLFEAHYINHKLVDSMKDGYKLVEAHVSDIRRGKVIMGKIENPFLLLREVARGFFLSKSSPKMKPSSAIALIYSLWACGLKKKR